MAKYSYCRVSGLQQDLSIQRDYALSKGVKEENIYEEKISGKNADREQLNRLKDVLQENDELYIYKLDRLARNTRDSLDLMDYFRSIGVILNFGDVGIIENNEIGNLIFTVLSAVSEMERNRIIERTQEGREWKRKNVKGYKDGRKQKLNKIGAENLYKRYKMGETVTELSKSYNMTRQTVYNYIKQNEI